MGRTPYSHPGFCPICRTDTVFSSNDDNWYGFRAFLFCNNCPVEPSVPRERAVALALHRLRPDWRNLIIHESSPVERNLSVVLARDCKCYLPTQLFPDVPRGTMRGRYRCEDLEQQTFPDGSFDIVVTQDVYEHILDPAAATREIYRTLRPGGISILTTGIWKHKVRTEQWAKRLDDGSIQLLVNPPEYHGNPISDDGSLVTYKYGYDFAELLAEWAPFDVEVRRSVDHHHGILGEFTDVVICAKPEHPTSAQQRAFVRPGD